MDIGLIDAAVVGGVDSLCLTTLHGFNALQLLSSEPCRPFDSARNGISIGEAAGFVLLDRDAGGGQLCSAAASPAMPGTCRRRIPTAWVRRLRCAWRCRRPGSRPPDIGYVNAHGTATPANDRAEAAAHACRVRRATRVPVSSTKGVTGHTLGAAGIIEAIVAMQALEQQALPPSANLRHARPAARADLVTQPRAAPAAPCDEQQFRVRRQQLLADLRPRRLT